nr:hypothetical protein [Tanacetum cinerariifolium]
MSAPKDGMPAENTYSAEVVRILDTHRTHIHKQPEMLLCLVGISRTYYLGDEVYPTFLHNDDRDMDLFSLLRAPNPTKMEGSVVATDSSGVPSIIERSLLDFANEAGASDQGTTAPEVLPSEDVPTTRELGMASTRLVPVPKSAPTDGTATAEDPESENASFTSAVGSPESIYRPEWGVANGSMLDTPEACQDLVDHVAPPGYFFELRHLHNDDFLRQYNVNLARQVAMGSQLRLRFEQEAKLLKKFVSQVARRDKRIQAREHEIKNLEALLEAEADMKKVAEEKVATLQEQVSGEKKLKAAFEEFKQYEDNRVKQCCVDMDARRDALSIDFDEELYPHMLTAIACRRWMIGRGLRLAVMKCGESLELRQAFADVVSAGIAKGMSEGLRHGIEHGHTQLSLESIEAYDPKAKTKYVAALQALKDVKYPLVDQLEGLKDAPMDVIMAALYLESNTGDDISQQVRDLRPSSSQLTIPVYPKVHDPMNPWAYKEEMLLADAIAANVSRAEKKKKCRIVCRTHGVGFAHHAWSDGVLVSVPTVVPQGLAILLADAATQTKPDEATLDNL